MKTGCALCFGWEILERATFDGFQKTYTSCRFWRLIPTEYDFLFFRDSFEAIKNEFLVRCVAVKGWKCGKMVPLWWCPLTESSKITSRFDNQQTFQFGILTEIPAKIASKKMPTEWCSNPFVLLSSAHHSHSDHTNCPNPIVIDVNSIERLYFTSFRLLPT